MRGVQTGLQSFSGEVLKVHDEMVSVVGILELGEYRVMHGAASVIF